MAPKKFPQFEKLPLEIRRRIWKLSHAPRIIRATCENETTPRDHKTICRLHAGHVPRLLHVNHEARLEGLRTYTLISSHIPYVTSKPLPRLSNNRTRKIYIDLEHDTIYLTNYHTTTGLLKWLSRLSMEEVGGAGTGIVKKPNHATNKDDKSILNPESEERIEPIEDLKAHTGKSMFELSTAKPKPKPGPGIRHLAFPSSMILTLSSQNRLDFFLSLAMLQPRLHSISIILAPKSFSRDREPGRYYLAAPRALGPGERGRLVGAKGERRAYRGEIDALFVGFWHRERKLEMGMGAAGMGSLLGMKQGSELLRDWESWIASRPEWVGPRFVLCELKKAKGLVL